MSFEDNFSKQSQEYARYRPQYPVALFNYLASLTGEHDLAWDCATGNGQAALGLAKHFRRVIATDASAQQIANATAHKKITYRVSGAELSSTADYSVDLITAASALHWLDLESFYPEVRRLLKPGGIIAAWSYHLAEIAPKVDHIISALYFDVLEGYWSPRIQYLNEHYNTIPFPFEELTPPTFTIETHWSLTDLTGFLNSWSATQKFVEAHGHSPIEDIQTLLTQVWGAPQKKRVVRWPLYLRIGRVDDIE